MEYYFIPALIALLFKLFIMKEAIGKNVGSNAVISLILVFACHNAIELIGYIRFLDDQTVSTLFRTYYVASILGLLALAGYSLTMANLHSPTLLIIITAVAVVLSILVLSSNSVIAGSQSIGYSITAIKGEYYSAFMLYALLMLLAIPSSLLYGFLNASTQTELARCLCSLLALVPLIVTSIVVWIFKTLEVEINSAGIVPIATTFYLYFLIKSESTHHITDFRRYLPFSLERRSAKRFVEIADSYARSTNRTNAYNEFREALERQAIFYTLEKCNGNVSQAAAMMGLANRSTLYSMMSRLNITQAERDQF